MSLLPVDEALARLLSGAKPTGTEQVGIAVADLRVLAEPMAATRTQPPWATSAMDGYAVRASDVESDTSLRVIGSAAAGARFDGTLNAGEAVRIFTGAPLPDGADTIVIQENVARDGDTIRVPATEAGRFVRPRGMDFSEGDALLDAGRVLTPARVALAAAMGHATVPVRRKPRFAILSTGDELVLPGENVGPDQIVASNNFGVAAMLRMAGAEATDLGVAPDDRKIIAAKLAQAVEAGADAVVTTGGASVGDHDHMQDVLADLGVEMGFWKIAMRPGKPLMFGRRGEQSFIGLPGNPVSAIVCARLFLVPLARALLGVQQAEEPDHAVLGREMPENDHRQDYVRARLAIENGLHVAHPFSRQDSSMLATLGRTDVLVVRPPHAPKADAGEPCRYVSLLPSID
ncbi:gephyrin-like molybdotransferase Glp [Tepidamorphus sp. 3E244]|uniref:molybdopterin molybdotransferase MoeA n=1 Tax=Tepidamorphus sp. 3E244 TaxID=3385498 RepID=UPI0038FC4CE4